MFERILVPVDGSHTSDLGINMAIGIARDLDSMVYLLHVVPEFIAMQDVVGGAVYADRLLEGMREGGRRILEKAEKKLRTKDVSFRSILIEEPAASVADVIVRQARKLKADVIVMGTHGRRGLSRLALGSDAETVLRESEVPVLFIRDKGKGGGKGR
jgi:nucleotide-binding universal stress UspA family protein